MDQEKMSVMQRLRAIRERMAVQAGEPRAAAKTEPQAEPQSGIPAVPQSEPGAEPPTEPRAAATEAPGAAFAAGSDADGSGPARSPAAIASATASMWDLAQDDDEPEEAGAAEPSRENGPDGPDAADPIAWLEAREATEPDPAPPEQPSFAAQLRNLADEAALRKPPLKLEPAPAHWQKSVAPKSHASTVETLRPDRGPAAGTAAGNAAEPGAPMRRAGRVKTRLLGFEHSSGQTQDVFEKARESAPASATEFPVGWLVVVGGPGRGASIALGPGVSQIGRDEDQAIQLDFGDTSISRRNHAALAYDEADRAFFIGHGGKSNIVRLNGKPLLSTESLKNGDEIRIGETTLRLVALCGEHFSWAAQDKKDQS